MPKPSPDKLNPAFQAAVKRMLATPPQPKKAVKKNKAKKTKT
jgi:hypothetical protein